MTPNTREEGLIHGKDNDVCNFARGICIKRKKNVLLISLKDKLLQN